LRSASNRERSKYAFLPQGSFELWRVASASRSFDVSTAFMPLKEREWTRIVPSSLHAGARATSASRRIPPAVRRMRRKQPQAVPHEKVGRRLFRRAREKDTRPLVRTAPKLGTSEADLLSCDCCRTNGCNGEKDSQTDGEKGG